MSPGSKVQGARLKLYVGGRQPLSLTLSFGEILWFDVRGEIQGCDWFKRNPTSENSYWAHTKIRAFRPITAQHCTFFRISNHGMSPEDNLNDSG
jgi:hypothetical protein